MLSTCHASNTPLYIYAQSLAPMLPGFPTCGIDESDEISREMGDKPSTSLADGPTGRCPAQG